MLAVHGPTGGIDAAGPVTSLGYSGEHFDAKVQQQYLRARWYDPANGRFNRLDPFAGRMADPQSLHKYAYVHGDPVQGADPTGRNLFLAGLGTAIHKEISQKYYLSHAANAVTYGTQIPLSGGAILPDIMDYSLGEIGEIKPLSPYGIATGEFQVNAATAIANGKRFTYRGVSIRLPNPVPHAGPQADWVPLKWQPGIQVVFPGRQNPYFASHIAVTLGNLDGVIYYHRIKLPSSAVSGLAAAHAIERYAVRLAEQIANEIGPGIRNGFDSSTQLIWQYRLEALLLTTVAFGAHSYGSAVVAKVNSLRISLQVPIPGLALGF